MSPFTPDKSLTLFISDDHKIIRDGLRVLIERTADLRVMGEAADGRALVEGVEQLKCSGSDHS